MTAPLEITPLSAIEGDIVRLIDEANAADFPFMETLRREWQQGTNRFDQPGETYLEVRRGGQLLAAGGINRDPYCPDPLVGRIRHVYVLAEARRSGVGRFLLEQLVNRARPSFTRLRLRTRTAEGAAFYEAFGFLRSDAESATHVLTL